MPQPRQGHITWYYDGYLYIHTGRVDGSKRVRRSVDDFWRFSLQFLVWEKIEAKGAVPSARHNHSCVVWKSCVYIFGGSGGDAVYNDDLFILDLANHTWWKINPANKNTGKKERVTKRRYLKRKIEEQKT